MRSVLRSHGTGECGEVSSPDVGIDVGIYPLRVMGLLSSRHLNRTKSLQHGHNSGGCVRFVQEAIHTGCKRPAPLFLPPAQGNHEHVWTEGAKSEYRHSCVAVKQLPRS